MWNPPADVREVTFANRLDWFAPPFNSSEMPSDLKKWKLSKGPKLSDIWALPNATVFIQNYLTMCEEYTRQKWRAQGAVSSRAAPESGEEKASGPVTTPSALAFKFDPNAAFATPTSDLQQMQADFNSVLMFFLKEVLHEDILSRVIHAFNVSDEPKSITWSQMLAIINIHLVQLGGLALLTDMVCIRRANGESLHAWCNRFALLRIAFSNAKIVLPEAIWIEAIRLQITRPEWLLVRDADQKLTFVDLKEAVDAVKQKDLPPLLVLRR